MVVMPEKKQLALENENHLLIACFCAEWCETCRKYKNQFYKLSSKKPEYQFCWIDIEEQSYLLDDEDIINFPTILIQDKYKTFFFGNISSNVNYLEKIIDSINKNNNNYTAKAPNLWGKLKKIY